MKESYEIEVLADIQNMESVWDFVKDRMGRHGCSVKEISQYLVIIEELFVNVAHYAYPAGKGRVGMSLTFCSDPDRVIFQISDSGVPFNPYERKDPDVSVPSEERKIGGLGIFLTKQLSDKQSYSYKDNKNIVTIEKKVAGLKWK